MICNICLFKWKSNLQ